MKKLTRILLIFSILGLTGCDFLRQVAGRPTEKEVEQKKIFIERRRKEISDSIKLVQAKLIEIERARKNEMERRDSVRGAACLDSIGMRVCRDFHFGSPVEWIDRRYNVVIGVFRQNNTAAEMMTRVILEGYYPYYIRFRDNVKTVCLCGGDSLGAIADTVIAARASGACPKDAWLYVRPEE